METTTAVVKILPLALALIMLGLGLSLKVEDFTRIARFPKPVLLGLAAQMLLLPFAALALCKLFNLSTELSIGMMILAASPGGTTANIFSHLSHGDVALNITLTAINSVLAAFTLPLIVGLSISYFLGEQKDIGLQFTKVIEVFAIVLVPVIIGMFISAKKPALAKKADRPFRIFSLLVLLAIVAGAAIREKENLMIYGQEVGAAVLAFNLISLAVGYVLPLIFKLPRKQAIAIAMEIGVHNGTLAMFIALSVLGNFTFAMPAAIYSILMMITAGLFALILKKREMT